MKSSLRGLLEIAAIVAGLCSAIGNANAQVYLSKEYIRLGGRVIAIENSSEFTFAASPASQSVTAGSIAAYTIAYAPSPGFTGTVSLSVSGLPAGASVAGGGAAACATGAGCLAGAPAIAGGVVVAAHGASEFGTAASNFMMSSSETGGSLPDDANVVRGGTNTPESFSKGIWCD